MCRLREPTGMRDESLPGRDAVDVETRHRPDAVDVEARHCPDARAVDSRTLTRRGYLAAVGTGAVAASAGCLGSSDPDPVETPGGPAASTGGWPQVGGSAGHDAANPAVSGLATDPDEAWHRELAGPVTTPTVADDTVYVTRGVPGDEGPQATLEAYALADGSRQWSTPLEVEGEPVTFRFSAPHSNLRPVYYRGRLHVALGDRVVAVDADSQSVAWTTEPHERVSFNSPPTVGPGGVYAGGLESLVAFDHDGSRPWAWPALPTDTGMADETGGPGSVRLAAAGDDRVYVSAGDHVATVDPADGSVAWKVVTGETRTSAVVYADGSLVRAGFRSVEARATDGTRQWRSGWPGKATIRPAVSDGRVFVAGLEGTVAAYDLASGERTWERTLEFTEWSQGTVPAVSDGVLHLLRVAYEAQRVRVHALDPASGASLWTLETDASRARGPVPAGGRLVFTSEVTPGSQQEESTVSAGQDTTTTLWAYEPGDG